MRRGTNGIHCQKDTGVIDEILPAFKDIRQFMANQSDLVETVAGLKELIRVKGRRLPREKELCALDCSYINRQ
ncbi:MAG: RtcB family protein [Methylotenera sp.]|nr:RtcB family protein [Oligoflexia bacterium]